MTEDSNSYFAFSQSQQNLFFNHLNVPETKKRPISWQISVCLFVSFFKIWSFLVCEQIYLITQGLRNRFKSRGANLLKFENLSIFKRNSENWWVQLHPLHPSSEDRGGSSTGAAGAFAPAEIWERVQCTRPEKDREPLRSTDLYLRTSVHLQRHRVPL